MLGGPPGAPYTSPSSKDGAGAADHDVAYTFGEQQTTERHPKFLTVEFARLLILRSHVRAGDRAYVEPSARITAPVE